MENEADPAVMRPAPGPKLTHFHGGRIMRDDPRETRRSFLARTAAMGGLAAAGCSYIRSEPMLDAVAGPARGPVGPDRPIRLGLIGAGGRCRALLKGAFKHGGFTVLAVAEPNGKAVDAAITLIEDESPSSLGAKLDVYRGEQDYRTRLLAREDIDAIIIATPPDLHARMLLDAFAAGKHIYSEKPMCLTVRETQAVVKAQAINPGVICQIGFQRRADPLYQKCIERIRQGAIGRLFGARTTWNVPWGPLGLPDSDRPWYGRRARSGDWMIEQANHTWDVLNWVTGSLPVAASGIGRKDVYHHLDPGRDVTDFYFAHVEYPDHFMVTHQHCWFTPTHDEWEGLNELDMTMGRFTGYFERVLGSDGGAALHEGLIFPRDPKKQTITIPGRRGYSQMTSSAMGAFFEAVRTGKKPVCDVNHGRAAGLVGLLVRKAVDESRRVTMEEITRGV